MVGRSLGCDLLELKTGVFCPLIAFDGCNIYQSNIIIFKTICIGVKFSIDFTRVIKFFLVLVYIVFKDICIFFLIF